MPDDTSPDSSNPSFIDRVKDLFAGLFSKNVTVEDPSHEEPVSTPPLRPFSPKSEWRVPVEELKPKDRISPPTSTPPPSEMSDHMKTKMQQMYNKYRHLVDQRDQINQERAELTLKVDMGKMSSAESHAQMVSLTREAAQLAEVIRELELRLAELGHPRFKGMET